MKVVRLIIFLFHFFCIYGYAACPSDTVKQSREQQCISQGSTFNLLECRCVTVVGHSAKKNAGAATGIIGTAFDTRQSTAGQQVSHRNGLEPSYDEVTQAGSNPSAPIKTGTAANPASAQRQTQTSNAPTQSATSRPPPSQSTAAGSAVVNTSAQIAKERLQQGIQIDVSGEVEACLADFKKKAEDCKTEGIAAAQKCNPKNTDSNKSYGEAQGVIEMMSQVSMAQGQKNGSPEACFRIGAIGTAAWHSLDMLKGDCEPELEQCKNTCEEANQAYSEIKKNCSEILDRALIKPDMDIDMVVMTATLKDSALEKVLAEVEVIKASFDKGNKACTLDALANQFNLKKIMADMDKSAQQAAKCQCQSMPGQSNCDFIKSPADCKLNPADPLCPKAIAIKCAGVDKDTKECVCLRDPLGANCSTNPSGPAQVAGIKPFNPINFDNARINSEIGGSALGLGDLGNEAVASKMSADKSMAAASPFASAAGGSGGGGSGGGGSGGGGESAPESESAPERTGIAGFFGQLKAGLSSALSDGGKNSATKKFRERSHNSSDPDPNQWRPKSGLRGIASASMGRRHMDIFKMINTQYMNQQSTFMSSQYK